MLVWRYFRIIFFLFRKSPLHVFEWLELRSVQFKRQRHSNEKKMRKSRLMLYNSLNVFYFLLAKNTHVFEKQGGVGRIFESYLTHSGSGNTFSFSISCISKGMLCVQKVIPRHSNTFQDNVHSCNATFTGPMHTNIRKTSAISHFAQIAHVQFHMVFLTFILFRVQCSSAGVPYGVLYGQDWSTSHFDVFPALKPDLFAS